MVEILKIHEILAQYKCELGNPSGSFRDLDKGTEDCCQLPV